MREFWLFLYLVIVAVGNYLAYRRYNERWARRERARVVVGVLVVLIPALAAGIGGVLDLFTVAIVLAAFGVAGLVTLHLDIDGETDGANVWREVFKN